MSYDDDKSRRSLTVDADAVSVNGMLSATDLSIDGVGLDEYLRKIIRDQLKN